MAIIGTIKNGTFVKDLGGFNVSDMPEATETTSGLMSGTDKKRLDNAYSTDDVASIESIENLFN